MSLGTIIETVSPSYQKHRIKNSGSDVKKGSNKKLKNGVGGHGRGSINSHNRDDGRGDLGNATSIAALKIEMDIRKKLITARS